MQYSSIDDLQDRLQEYFLAGDYRSALDLAAAGMKQFPEHVLRLAYWQMTLTARLEDSGQTLQLFKAVLDSGGWYGESLLRQSPSFKALQELPAFEQLIARNQQQQEADPLHAFPLITLRSQGLCQPEGPPCPLMLALHANASTAQASLPFWKSAASTGWLVGIPQSAQPLWKDAYVWDDRQFTAEEISRHYSALTKKYAVDPANMILAGHSMGGEMAIWLALRAVIPANGFIALGPGGPFMDNLELWQPLIQDNYETNLRGYIIIGQQDRTISQDNAHYLAEQFNQSGIRCRLEVIPDVGHDFSVEYEASLLRALDYIQVR